MKQLFNNILVVRTDRMGDVILTTPALKALRQTYPQARITFLVNKDLFDLAKNNPYINELLVDDRKKENRGVFGFWKLVSLLKSKKFDLAVVFHTKRRTNLACFLAGIPNRLGYKNDKFGGLLTMPVFDSRAKGTKHEVNYCLDLLQEIGISASDQERYVHVSPEGNKWLQDYLGQERIGQTDMLIAVHPGASDTSRIWPEENFSTVINRLIEKYHCRVVLIGSASGKEVAKRIALFVKQPLLDVTGTTSITQLTSLLKRCSLLISNDSGPVHLADALGVPVVSIFIRNQPGINPERWRPLGLRSKVIAVSPDQSISFAKAGTVDPKKLQPIQPEQVLEAVDAIFKLC